MLCLFFSWNVQQREETFGKALEHLATVKVDGWIACFQELPGTLKNPAELAKALGRWKCNAHVLALTERDRPLCILCSTSVQPGPKPTTFGPRRRFAFASAVIASKPVFLVGLHAFSRLNGIGGLASEFERGSVTGVYRRIMEERWPQGWPCVVLGDFNTQPCEPEIHSHFGMYMFDAEQETSTPPEHCCASQILDDGVMMRRLVLPVREAHPAGARRHSVWIRNDDIKDQLVDMIAVSWELVPHAKSLTVLSTLETGVPLVKSNNRINKALSDHLPVQLRIDIGA